MDCWCLKCRIAFACKSGWGVSPAICGIDLIRIDYLPLYFILLHHDYCIFITFLLFMENYKHAHSRTYSKMIYLGAQLKIKIVTTQFYIKTCLINIFSRLLTSKRKIICKEQWWGVCAPPHFKSLLPLVFYNSSLRNIISSIGALYM